MFDVIGKFIPGVKVKKIYIKIENSMSQQSKGVISKMSKQQTANEQFNTGVSCTVNYIS